MILQGDHMKERRNAVWAELRSIVDAAKAEKRGLNDDERKRFEELDAEMRGLDEAIAADERLGIDSGAAATRHVVEDDQPQALTREQKLTDTVDFDAAPGDAGRYVRAMLTGNWRGSSAELLEYRALAEGTGAAGGFLVPTPLAATILDKARNKARVIEAGAVTVPMNSRTQKYGKVVDEPTPGWRNENALVPEGDITFDAVEFVAQSLAVLVRASREVLQDVPGMEVLIEDVLAQAFALELDRVALYGSGVLPEPRGLRNTTGVTITPIATNGGAPTWEALVRARQRVEDKNFVPGPFVAHGRTFTGLSLIKDTTGQYVAPPATVASVPQLGTSQVRTNETVGTGTNLSSVFTGQWDMLGIGLRHGFVLQPLVERYADTGQIGFVCHLRADVKVFRPEAFEVISGVTA